MIARRHLLIALLSLTGLALLRTVVGRAASDLCPRTPLQTEGPYYPPRAQRDAMPDKDNDLTQISGRSAHAKGQIIYVIGEVRDEQCRPVEGALVEIWQASENGRYQHPRDEENPAPLDPHFQYWSQQVTDGQGRYRFKTIKPGAYQAGRNWIRPPHIHFKVKHPRFRELTTQMYFAGDLHQDEDLILNRVPEDERDRVIVKLQPQSADYDYDTRIVRFDLILVSP
jgi:protocatechuate 3,4-dioxygenase, beta subunit